MKELTYILGAGASYESFPIVKTFANRFDYFKRIMELDSKIQSDEFIKQLNDFSNEIKSHQSFDTYFKKLFHLGNEIQILTAKKIISLYFLWEQLELPKSSPFYYAFTDVHGDDLEGNENYRFEKKSVVDSRYDALIAGLLKPLKGKSEFFTKINFISWNYDLNLIGSIKNFINPKAGINDFILDSIRNNNNNVWDLGKDLQILNMNGYFFSEYLDNLTGFDHLNVIEAKNRLYEKKDTFSFNDDINENNAKKINFGWENFEIKSELIDLAARAIKSSKTVIAIGYTFPLYNRLIDLDYFNPSTLSNTDVYIQDPKANEIVEFLKSDFGLHDAVKNKLQSPAQAPRIHSRTNCDSFFIPNNIYHPNLKRIKTVLPK